MQVKFRLLTLILAFFYAFTLNAQTVVDIIVNSNDHDTLETAVVAAGLDGTLSGDGPFTVFAPTDDAFAALPAGLLDTLLNDPSGSLTDVLLYHVLGDSVVSGDLSNGQIATTINGDSIIVTLSNGNVFINNAQVTVADITATNGVVHVLDAVLVPGSTVLDVITNSPDHTTLETAVVAAELAGALSDPFGTFTVFAPTDDAFANLDPALLNDLLNDPTGALADVLLYHVLGAEVASTDLSNGQIATTLNGDSIIVTLSNGNVFINNAQVTVADIVTDNGIVHVLDAVLVPGSTVLDVITNSPDHTTLEAAVVAAELAGALSNPFGTFTVFAPTDDAFANLDPALLNDLLNDPTGALADVLLYHVLGAEVASTDLSNGQIATTLNGDSIIVTLSNGNVFINNAQVTVADIVTDNGIVHVLDAVLVPGSTVLDVITNSPDHTTLEAAVVTAELAGALSNPFGTFTVFAPTDDAFANLDPALLNDLLNDPTGALADVLLYHVLGAEVASTDLSNGQIATTLNGDSIIVTLSNGNVFINNAQVTVADIVTDNGIVHVLDAVLVPGSTVLDVITNSPDHTTLETAVVAAELAGALSNPFGTFTVFAPTDDAFANLDPALLNDLLNDPTGALADVLLYHVLGAEVASTDLSNGQIATTLNGDSIIVTLSNGNVFINNAQVTVADIVTDNGIVHVLDAVLVPGSTVLDVITNSPDHTTLEAAVVAAELAGALSDPFGTFTVFAPTDDAFNALPAGVLDDLLMDPTGALADVLLYHVLGAEVLSGDLSNGQIATTLNGDDIVVTISGGNVFINNAQVTVADITTDNGVVHVIDAVLVPGETVLDVVVNSPDHTILETAVVAAELAGALSNPFGTFTVFAPTDDAFNALPAGVLDDLLMDPTGALADVLLYHVLGAEVLSGDLSNGQIATTVNGDDIIVTLSGGNVFINNAQVTVADITTDNGVVHVIDAVLVPGETVLDVVVNSPDHTILETAVVAAELAGALSNPFGTFTVFAPTDDAFNALPAGVLDDLLMDPTGALADVLLYHVLGAEVLSGDLSNGQIATTVNGDDIIVTLSGGNVFINNAQVTVADITTDNGVVHVLDAVLVPGNTVLDVIVNSADHTTLETAVVAAELAGALSNPFGTFTVFAPTDDAFNALPAGVLDDLLMDPTGALADVLLYHVLGAEVLSGDLSNGQIATTLNGDSIIVTIADGDVFINNAQVIVTDITTDNGVVHVIDTVLVPGQTVLDVITNSPDHTILETALIAAEVAGALAAPFETFTVFAPTDAAFNALPAGVLDDLLMDPTGDLADVLSYHVLGAEVLSSDLSNGQIVTTLNGDDVVVTISGGNVFINNAQVTVADIIADNGVVHVIDAVLVPGETVLDVVVNSPDHTILETAVVAAELAGALSDPFGTFTVFAPTDDAFNALPAGVLDDLLMDPTGALADVLLYHVLGAEVLSGDLSNGQIATTVNGDDIIVTLSGGNVFINNAQVTVADITTDNGVVHVLDAVLVPGNTVLDVIVNSADHTTLETAVVAAELAGALSDPFGTFTVFAPTDDAFNALPAGVLDDLLMDPTGALADVLLYHVLGAEVLSGDLSNGQIATTVNGDDIIVTLSGGNVFINNAQVTVADITTDNGVVHVLDAVLVPGNTVLDVIVNSADHTTLETAVVAAELAGALSDPFGTFTVFAPTDDAFNALPAGVLDDLLMDPTGALADVLLYHVLGAEVLSGDLSNGQIATTLNGDDIVVTISGGNVFINNAQVTVADITTDNGVVHVLDAVLVPGETVVDVVINSADHTTLETAIIAAELADDLTNPFGTFTVFAPTDDAFDNLPAGVLDDLLMDPTGALANVLLYHVLGSEELSGDLMDGAVITTLSGDDITVTIDGGDVFINQAQVIIADIQTDNGVVHVINAVLTPGTAVESVQSSDTEIDVFPNPTSDYININLEKAAEVQLFDTNGRSIQSWNVQSGRTQLNVAQLPTGTYFLLFNIEGNAYSEMIVID